MHQDYQQWLKTRQPSSGQQPVEFGRQAKLNEVQSKAKTRDRYAEQFSKRADLFQKMTEKYRNVSIEYQSAAQAYEDKSAGFTSKSRTSHQKAVELKAVKAEYTSKAKQGYKSFETAKSRSQVAPLGPRIFKMKPMIISLGRQV
jgi:hypothetical protein